MFWWNSACVCHDYLNASFSIDWDERKQINNVLLGSESCWVEGLHSYAGMDLTSPVLIFFIKPNQKLLCFQSCHTSHQAVPAVGVTVRRSWVEQAAGVTAPFSCPSLICCWTWVNALGSCSTRSLTQPFSWSRPIAAGDPVMTFCFPPKGTHRLSRCLLG